MKILNDYKPPLFLKRFIQVLGVITTVLGATMFYLENSFVTHPHNPQPELGRTVAYAFKGAIFFITPNEHFWINFIYYAFTTGLLIVAALIVYVLAKMEFPLKGER